MKMKKVYLFFLNLLLLTTVISVKSQDCDNMQIDFRIDETMIYVRVSPAFCSFMYTIIHYVDCEEVNSISLPQPVTETSFDRHPNSRNRIAVELPDSDGAVVYTDFVDGIVDDRVVQNLQFNEVNKRFEWEALEDSVTCNITYRVRFNNERESEVVTETTDPFFEISPHPCTNNEITVTPVIRFDNSYGEDAFDRHTIKLVDSKVQDLRFSESNSRFQWTEPEDSSRCDITYDVRVSNEIYPDLTTQTTNPYVTVSLYPCTNNKITVTTMIGFDDSIGQDASAEHTVRLVNSAVQDLQFNELDDRFEWTPPEHPSRCDIRYQIRVSNGIDPDLTRETTDTFIAFSLHPCTENKVTVTTIIGFDDTSGQDTYVMHTVNLIDSEIRDLRFSEANNQFEWTEPEDSSRCDIKYDVRVSNGIDPELASQTTDTFMAFFLHPCTHNEVTVIAMIGFDESTGESAFLRHTVNLADSAVQDLQFNELDDRFEWTPPEHPSRCEIRYQIRVSNGIDPDLTRETTDTFTAFSLHPCTENKVTVTTIIGFDDSSGQDVYVMHTVNLIDSKVQDLRFSESNGRFEWTEPEDSSRCDIKYDVRFSNGIDPELTRQTTDTFIAFYLHPCTHNEVTVIAMIGFDESTGESASVRHTVNLVDSKVQDLRFSESNGRFEWTEPEDSSRCDITYDVRVSNEIYPDLTTETTNPFVTVSLYPCTNNKITVTTMIGFDDSTGEDASAEHTVSLVNSAVQDLQFDELDDRFEWTPPEHYSRCDIRYQIRVSNGIDPDLTRETTDTFIAFSLHPCTENKVTVTTIIGFDDSSGQDTYVMHTVNLIDREIRDLRFSEANNRFEWTEPEDSSRCDIKYDVRVSNGIDPELTSQTTDTFIAFFLRPCTHNEVTVTAMIGFDESTGESASLRHAVNLVDSKVQDLRFSESNGRFEWTEPEDSSRCEITYDVRVSNEIYPDLTTQTTNPYVTVSLYPCTNNKITVTTMIGFDDSIGQDASAEHTVSLVNSAVQDLQFDELDDRFEWTPPEHYSRCDIRYQIRVSNGIDPDLTRETTDTFIAFSLHPCTENKVTVTTIIGFDDTSGQDTYVMHTVNLIDREIRDLRFSEANNRFEWTEPEDSSRCDIKYDVRVSNGIDPELTSQTTDTFIAFFLRPCTHNEVTVTAMIGFDESTGESASLRHAVNLVDSKVQDLQFIESNGRFEWTEPEDSSRCDITYDVRVSNEIYPDLTTQTTNPYVTVSLYPCTNNKIIVTTMIGFDDSIGQDASAEHTVSLADSAVQDLQFNELGDRFEWTAPEHPSRCDIRYKIRVSNGIDPDLTDETTDTFIAFPLHPCTDNEITVTTIIGFDDSIGQDAYVMHRVNLVDSGVRNLRFSESNDRFEWTAPDDSNRCNIKYDIRVRDGIDLDLTAETTDPFITVSLHSCTNNEITVTTMIGFDESTGENVSAMHTVNLANSAVQDLHFNELYDRFEWTAPDHPSRCDIRYKIRASNEVDPDLTEETTDTFIAFSLHPCTNNEITVTTMIGFDDSIGQDASAKHTVNLVDSEVRNLRFSEANSRFEWTEPEDSSRCGITYDVRVSNGIDPDLTAETTDPFITVSLHPCTNNDITVTTMIGFDDSTGQSASVMHTVNLVDSEVRDLRFSESNGRFEWTEPGDSSRCSLKYDIRVSNGIDPDLTEQTTDTFIVFSGQPCTNNEVTVTTLIGFDHSIGQAASAKHTVSLVDSAVQDLQFNELYDRFEWTAPDHPSRCEIRYKIRASNEVDPDLTEETTDTFIAFSLHPCTYNEITVTTMIGFDNSTGQYAYVMHTVNLVNTAIQDLQFNEEKERFEWVAPEDSTRCDIKYQVRVSNGIDPDQTEDTTDPFIAFFLHPCTNNEVTVTARIGFDGSIGQESSARHTVYLVNSAVQDLQFNEEKERFEWIAPENSSRCNLRYRIRFSNEINADVWEETANEFFEISSHSCTNNEITVTTMIGFDNSIGQDSSDNHPISLDKREVRNLHFNADNSKFEWEAPDDSGRCELEYTIIYYRNGILVDQVVTTELRYQIPLYFCSTNLVAVATKIGFDNTDAENVYYSHHISVPPVIEVEDISFDEIQSRFYWSAPEKSELCKLEYRVEFLNNALEEPHIVRTSNEYFAFSVYPCSNNHIKVTTLVGYDQSESETVLGQHAGPLTRQLPRHVRTNPQPTSAEVTWEIAEELYNFCEVDVLRYEVTNVDSAIETEFTTIFQEGTKVDYRLINLQVDQLYRYRLCFIFSTPYSAICGEDITFLTRALSKPQITTLINSDENIEISWKQTYYSSFITGHTVVIEPIEPNHFVPYDCVFDKTPTIKNFETDTASYILKDPLPSFKYNIKVVTHFEGLGMTTEDVDEIATNENTPDQLNIQYSYKYVTTSRYDVSLLINWTIPCDINGNIEKFSYAVYKDFYNNKDAMCNDLFKSGIVTVTEDEQETYDIAPISNILPFFRYSVEVTTSLERHDTKTTIDLVAPPQPFTPSP